jgi:hypothetical protein
MFIILSVTASLNAALFFWCHASLTRNASSGPEGIGTAILAFCCVFVSAILSAFSLNQLYAELRNRVVSWRTLLASFLAIIPLLFFLLVDVLPFRSKPQHPKTTAFATISVTSAQCANAILNG